MVLATDRLTKMARNARKAIGQPLFEHCINFLNEIFEQSTSFFQRQPVLRYRHLLQVTVSKSCLAAAVAQSQYVPLFHCSEFHVVDHVVIFLGCGLHMDFFKG